MPDGSYLDVDASRSIEIGDIVVVVLRAEGAFAGLGRRLAGDGLLGVTKIFLGAQPPYGDAGTIYLLGQLNPPIVAPVPEMALQRIDPMSGSFAS